MGKKGLLKCWMLAAAAYAQRSVLPRARLPYTRKQALCVQERVSSVLGRDHACWGETVRDRVLNALQQAAI